MDNNVRLCDSSTSVSSAKKPLKYYWTVLSRLCVVISCCWLCVESSLCEQLIIPALSAHGNQCEEVVM